MDRKTQLQRIKMQTKTLLQRKRPYLQVFRQESQQAEEQNPEHYAEQRAARFGRAYADTVKAQGRKLIKWQAKRQRPTRKHIIPKFSHRWKTFILTGGSFLTLIFVIIIPICAAAAVFGSDDDSEVTSNNALVAIAQSQIGNEGGETYWRWYGFESHVDWCATFVSWCADQAGLLETDSLPRYAVCDDGIRWFIRKEKWYNRRVEPKPGMVIFFDWDHDGISEHTGIVEKCEDGMIYTIEGNSQNMCRKKWYVAGDRTIMGYGGA